MRDYTSTAAQKYEPRVRLLAEDTYIEARVHCSGRIQIPDDALQGTGSRKVCEEGRVLPMHDSRHNEILEIVCDDFDILPLSRRST
jgi:hypothetical protein